MGRYIIRRILWAFVVLFVILAITFIIFNVLPSADPALQRAGRLATPERVAEIRKTLGLDQPKIVQFGRFLKNLVKGPNGWFDLGYSYHNNVAVRPEIMKRIPATAFLALGAAVVWLTMGLTVGIISAIKRRTAWDRVSMVGALVGISAPVYWLGLMALFLFGKDVGRFKIFPGQGSYLTATTFFSKVGSLLMPWFVLALAFAAFYARMVRGNLLEVMSEDYIRTARAKGLSENRVVYRHGLRAALTPIVTIFGLDLAGVLGGAILTETVFNIPGIGRYAFGAIRNGDLPAIQGTVLFAALFIVVANLLVDIAYAYLDPRVRYT
jgi:peptide/nickel transport system permease protein